jgi:hypothetical protein
MFSSLRDMWSYLQPLVFLLLKNFKWFGFQIFGFERYSRNTLCAIILISTFYYISRCVSSDMIFWADLLFVNKLFNQGYVAHRLNSSLRNDTVVIMNCVTCYIIFISQMAMDFFSFYIYLFMSSITDNILTGLDYMILFVYFLDGV